MQVGVTSMSGMPGWGHLWFLLLSVTSLFLGRVSCFSPFPWISYYWLDHVYKRLVEKAADTVDLPYERPGVEEEHNWPETADDHSRGLKGQWCHGLDSFRKKYKNLENLPSTFLGDNNSADRNGQKDTCKSLTVRPWTHEVETTQMMKAERSDSWLSTCVRKN